MAEERLQQCTNCQLIYRQNEILKDSQGEGESKKCPNCGCTFFTFQAPRKWLSFILAAALTALVVAAIRLTKVNIGIPLAILISLATFILAYLVISRLQGPTNIMEDLEYAGHKMGAVGAKLAKQKSWYKAIQFYERALKLLEGSPRQDLVRWTLERLGTAYMATGNLNKTKECYENALKIAEDLGDQKIQAQILHNLKVLERKRNDGLNS